MQRGVPACRGAGGAATGVASWSGGPGELRSALEHEAGEERVLVVSAEAWGDSVPVGAWLLPQRGWWHQEWDRTRAWTQESPAGQTAARCPWL